MLELKDGTRTPDARRDRLVYYDPASLNYRIRGALAPQQRQPHTTQWYAPPGTPVLDQGNEGACVAFGVTNELLFYPYPIPRLDGTFAVQQIYWPAQRADPWPGGAYPGATPRYDGTAVLFGIKAAAALGYYKEYRCGTSEPEMAAGVSWLGPAIIGVNWMTDMEDPDRNGVIHATGEVAGGHCTLVTGINVERGYYRIRNSWGPRWGLGGDALISRDDMARLLADDGECWIITQRALGNAPAAR